MKSLAREQLVLLLLLACLVAGQVSASTESKSSGGSSSQTGTQARQSTSTVLSTLGMLVPGLISSVAPLVLLFGIGAMMMPALGMGAMGLLRESRRSANDQPSGSQASAPNMALQSAFSQLYGAANGGRPLQVSPQDYYYFSKRSLPGSLLAGFNGANLARGLQDVAERLLRALDNADRRGYN